MAEVCFQVSGTDAEVLTADRTPFRIDVHTVDSESEASNLVASEEGQLEPQVFEYTSQPRFPIPGVGRYKLQSDVVLLLPSGEMRASHVGPTFRVDPWWI